MKKILLAATAVALSGATFAQNQFSGIQEAPKPQKVGIHTAEYRSVNYIDRAGGGASTAALGDTIMIETFGNGYNGDGTNGAWTNNGSTSSAIWEYRGSSTTPNNTVGSRGAYAGTGGSPIASPTVSNGFMIFDSDYLDNGGTAGAFGQGPAATPHNGELLSPVIDLSTYPEVIMQMNVKYRRFVGDLFVVFDDGSGNWLDSVQVFGEALGTPTNSPHTDDVVSVYVSNYIGGISTARFKLFFDGTTTHGNPNGSGYYYAQVDDILLIEAPDNDLVMDQQYIHTSVDTGNKRYYTEIPYNHSVLDTVFFGGDVTNLGTATQQNTRVNTYITEPNGNIALRASQAVNLTAGSSDSLTATSGYTFNAGLGTYNVAFTAESDSTDDVPADNVIDWTTIVSDTVYARDRDAAGGTGRWYGAGTNYEIGNLYTIRTTDTVTSISVRWMSLTAVGSVVSLNVYDGSLTTPVVSRQFISLTANDIDQWATFDITDTELTPGDYIVTYETFSDSVLWAFDIDDPQADPQTVFVDPDNSGTWFFTSSLPMIRMNLKGFNCPSLGLTASNVNPSACGGADGTATISVGGSNCATCNYDWGDTAAVGLSTRNDLAAGSYNVTVFDATGCSDVIVVNVPNANAPIVDQVNVTDVTCFGDANGEINLSMSSSSGTAPFTYDWSTGSQTSTPALTGLSSGTYDVTIEDAAGCLTVETGMAVTEPSSALTSTAVGDDNGYGSGSVTASGGTPPYTYLWSTGETTSSISGSDGGNLTVTVTDANGCEDVQAVYVTPVGTNDLAFASSLNVFPNPNGGTFNISFEELTGTYTINVVSTIGQVVDTRVVAVAGTHIETLDNVSLTKGIYFVNVSNEEGSEATFRVVVK